MLRMYITIIIKYNVCERESNNKNDSKKMTNLDSFRKYFPIST